MESCINTPIIKVHSEQLKEHQTVLGIHETRLDGHGKKNVVNEVSMKFIVKEIKELKDTVNKIDSRMWAVLIAVTTSAIGTLINIAITNF